MSISSALAAVVVEEADGWTVQGYQLAGGGGGGGYTSTALNVSVSAGQVLNCSVGAGGSVDNSISSQWSRSGLVGRRR